VNIVEHGLAARVEAETPEARTILLENLPALRERLAEQGIKLERFDVDLPRQQSGQDRGHQPDQTPSRQPPAPPRVPRAASEADVSGPGTKPPQLAQLINDRRLNVVI
jgi:flagellar hook-length control protein FliK